MKQTESGLWIAPNINFLRFRKKTQTVTLPNGERAKITVDDSGTVTQIEHGDVLDGIVRPQPVRLSFHVGRAAANAAATSRPQAIRTAVKAIFGG